MPLTCQNCAKISLLQEVSLIVLRRIGEYEPGTNFGAWAREIARRCILDRAKRWKLSTMEPGVLDLLAKVVREPREQHAAITTCLETLAPEARRIVQLRYSDGKDGESIARATRKTISAVYAVLKRAKEVLRECADRKLRDEP